MPSGATLKLWRSRRLFMDYGGYLAWHYGVIIDGIDIGDIWPGQVKVFDISPGDHTLQLRLLGPLRGSAKQSFSVAAGEQVVFECHTGWNFFAQLRPATHKDREDMERATAQPPTPRDLGHDGPASSSLERDS